MCGIAGIYKKSGVSAKERDLLSRMSESIRHRGPDGDGVFFDDRIGLAHRRLSILDVSEKGAQPMHYLDRYVIVYNGEIYNYIELRDRLKESGYTFTSGTDTEVILAAYDHYGRKCVEMFNGMWAFILYDREKKEVFISRDRYGVKPLFYYKKDGYFIFASEIKALLCDEEIERVANDELVYDFLVDSLADHTEGTFFRDIYHFPPATRLTIALDDADDAWDFETYYDVDFSKAEESDTPDSFVRTKKRFRRIFHDAVKKRLRSDVPVGNCLSGGLDSSAIVTAVSRIYGTADGKAAGAAKDGGRESSARPEQHTFSFCPSDKKINERPYIDEVLAGRDIHPHFIGEERFEDEKDFRRIVRTQDEPFGSMSIFASYLVYRSASENRIKVLLDGQGADELLCGYRKSRIYYIKRLVGGHHYLRAGRELLQSVSQLKTSLSIREDIKKAKKVLRIKNEAGRACLRKDFVNDHQSKTIYSEGDFQNADVKVVSLPVLLRYADRNSMSVSVESRLPFLDYRLVDLCARIPVSMKIKNGYSKYIMRASLELPRAIKYRKSKLGFEVPEKAWIKAHEDFFKGYFDPDRFRAGRYIDRSQVKNDWDKMLNGMDASLLFRMISVAAWMEEYEVSCAE